MNIRGDYMQVLGKLKRMFHKTRNQTNWRRQL
jgi:hypothetical protein